MKRLRRRLQQDLGPWAWVTSSCTGVTGYSVQERQNHSMMTSHYLQHGPFHGKGVTELLGTRPGDEVVHHVGGFIAPREQSPLPGGHAAAVVPGLNIPSLGGRKEPREHSSCSKGIFLDAGCVV